MYGLLTALACELDLSVRHVDIEQAFVQSVLDEDVLVRPPSGRGNSSGKILRLDRSLYGLRQASRQWRKYPAKCVRSLGFDQCSANSCVFRLMDNDRVIITLLVHVDDIFAVGDGKRV